MNSDYDNEDAGIICLEEVIEGYDQTIEYFVKKMQAITNENRDKTPKEIPITNHKKR